MENESTESSNKARLAILELANMISLPMSLNAVVQLNVPDAIWQAGSNNPLSASQILARALPSAASSARGDSENLQHILRMLTSYGVFAEHLDGSERKYSLTEIGKTLITDSEGLSYGPYVLQHLQEMLMRAWPLMHEAVVDPTSEPFMKATGEPAYSYYGKRPEMNGLMQKAMSGVSVPSMKAILDGYDRFEGVERLVDVGGSAGDCLRMILQKHPNVRQGINFDLPEVVAKAPNIPGVCHVGGDMVESIPTGDAIFMKFTTGDTPYTSARTFEDLNLTPELLKGLYVEMKFHKPSKIQAISLPMILTPPYKNLVAQAHSGSGKATCFVLGMLSRVDPNLKAPQALCICPTRELAIQNLEVLRKMGKYTGITSECAIPMDSTDYMSFSKRPPVRFTAQIVIGTPGIIKKWMSPNKKGVSSVKVLVFDEADHMLAEDRFKDDSLWIMKDIQKMSAHCQVLLFSATFNETVKNFVSRVVNDHNQLFVKKDELSLESVKQYKVNCSDELSKVMVIKDRIFELGENLGQTIIFVHMRNSASMLHKSLVELGYEVTTIQGASKQEDRDKIVKEFKDGLTQVLISNDLLARGFDQQQVNLVINYDLPVKHENSSEPDYEVYFHRIGRAGRFGRKGAVFNLLMSEKDRMLMEKIERHFNSQITQVASWNSAEDFKAALKAVGLL